MQLSSLIKSLILLVPFCGQTIQCTPSTSLSKARTNSIDHREEVEAIYDTLKHPHDCHLTLICLVQSDTDLRKSDFMNGIRFLANQTSSDHARNLASAIKAGQSGDDCSTLSETCTLSEEELIDAIEDMNIDPPSSEARRVRRDASARQRLRTQPQFAQPDNFNARIRGVIPNLFNKNKRQSFVDNMPPFVRPLRNRRLPYCRRCDSRRTVCSVYSIGTYVGCTGVWMVSGIPGQIACNVMTSPGSIGCGVNSLNCYMHGCGLVDIPDNVRELMRENNIAMPRS